MPDVSYVSWARLPDRKLPSEAIPDLVPDLAIEVLSASNTKQEMERKRRDYFQAGSRQVWLVDGKAREFHVYTGVRKRKVYQGDATVPGGNVLPGFELALPVYFERVGLQG